MNSECRKTPNAGKTPKMDTFHAVPGSKTYLGHAKPIIKLDAKVVKMFLTLTIFAKFSIIDNAWQGTNHVHEKD